MTHLEIKTKKEQLEKIKKSLVYYWGQFEQHGDKEDFKIAQAHYEEARKLQLEINQLKAQNPKCTHEVKTKTGYELLKRDIEAGKIKMAKTRLKKEMQIVYHATACGMSKDIFATYDEAEKGTAIIDEIIESEINARAKLLLIKLFINGKISPIEIDAILSNE